MLALLISCHSPLASPSPAGLFFDRPPIEEQFWAMQPDEPKRIRDPISAAKRDALRGSRGIATPGMVDGLRPRDRAAQHRVLGRLMTGDVRCWSVNGLHADVGFLAESDPERTFATCAK